FEITVQAPFVLATAPGKGGGPNARYLDFSTTVLKYSLFTFPANFTGGVRVASADVNGDGVADFIVGAGPNGGPQRRRYDGSNGHPLPGVLGNFFAFDPTFTGGVWVAAGDINADGKADVIVGADAGGGPEVRVFDGATGTLIRDFFAYGINFTGGVRVAA